MIAAVFAFIVLAVNLAITSPWKASIKQARKM
jgi:hypothetical protein